jgi:2-oxoglutarate/2-oxoacid ferredoxin oxidoreductase subunit alpha
MTTVTTKDTTPIPFLIVSPPRGLYYTTLLGIRVKVRLSLIFPLPCLILELDEDPVEYSIKIGGEAGQGIQTIGDTLSKVFSRSGYHVFTHQDYMSRVRGGHNFYQIRVSDKPVTASRERIDIVVALDRESVDLHAGELSDGGIIVYDSTMLKTVHEKPEFFDVPLLDFALKTGGEKIMANTVATGAVLGMIGLDLRIFFAILEETLGRKGEDIVAANRGAAEAGHDFAATHCTRCSFSVPPGSGPKLLIGANEAIGLGAIGSGCKFYSAYPMTPSTGIMLFIADKAKEYGIIVEQAEDEIAAINMAIGASFAGVRAMTGTSGGGFALMVEGLSLAAMTETPLVIALAQRPGPATGLPTRTEQADLLYALHSGHGEFPRAIFAPGSPEQAFYLVNKAFHISQKYQIPVFIVTDQYLADSQWTFEGFDLERLLYTDYRIRGENLQGLAGYRRHALTEDGVSPFAVPGASRHLVITDSDEHDEEGHIIEDSPTRTDMVNKRLFRKGPLVGSEINPPLLYGHSVPDFVVVGWGSTFGVMKEAVDVLSEAHKVAMLHFSEVYPLPSRDKLDYLGILNKARMTVCVENNAAGQFAWLMRAETGFEFTAKINKYDGRPFTLDSLVGEINACIGRL